MSWSQYLPDDRVKWTRGFYSYPIWPTEPDISIIKDIVTSTLKGKVIINPDSDISVTFLASGAHHKIYEVTQPSWPTTYLFRVAIPLDPCLKVESEMATLQYLRQRTTIPVPKPVAWSSVVDEKLGYEWSLLEKIPGVELHKVWRQVPWEKKISITETLASFLVQIWSDPARLSQIGSLYFAKPNETNNDSGLDNPQHVPNNLTDAPILSSRMVKIDDTEDLDFAIGPSVDAAFFTGRRRYLSSYRGPYRSCQDWLRSLIGIEQEFLKSAKIFVELGHASTTQPMDEREWACLVEEAIGYDGEDFLDGFDANMEICEEYLRLLPLIFPTEEAQDSQPRFFLHHCDLREANILVDPETFDITGIIDWEETIAVPSWYGLGYPMIINTDEPASEQRSAPPETYDEEAENYNPAKVAEHDRWDAKLLRGEFDKKLEKLGWTEWHSESQERSIKSRFIEGVSDLSDSWTRAKNCIRRIKEDLADTEQDMWSDSSENSTGETPVDMQEDTNEDSTDV
ncbi:phosphotransferase enzyme family-domain-containing protein [Xylariaceae sp. FL0662B]|nr:phosphotransferase enzyme family-domain-containing protein [Xylariaceae sp. FL0662B]